MHGKVFDIGIKRAKHAVCLAVKRVLYRIFLLASNLSNLNYFLPVFVCCFGYF